MYGLNWCHNPGVHDIYPMRKNNNNIPKPVIMSWHDRSNLLEMQSALTFQLSLGFQHLNRLTGRLRAWMEAKENSSHSNTDDKNTKYRTACLTEQIHLYASIHASEPMKWDIMALIREKNYRPKMEDVRIFSFRQSCGGELWVCTVSYSFDGLKWSICII